MSWPISQASAAIEAIADSGRLVLGLDIRGYHNDGTFLEIPRSSYTGSDVEQVRRWVLSALGRSDLPGDRALGTGNPSLIERG